MMNCFIEPKKELPIYGKYDTVIVGGGFAGIAAAVAAARGGNKVLLCERMFMLGGLGTSGLVTIYLPLCDGHGNQLSFGLAEELLKVSIEHGYEAMYPKAWLEGGATEERKVQRYRVRYNASACAISMEKLLLKEGVELLYGTTVCDVAVDNGVITHLLIENKSGRSAVEVGNVIDCSGDADVCYFAGENTVEYAAGNNLAAWYYHCENGKNELRILGLTDDTIASRGGLEQDGQPNAMSRRFTGLDADELTKMTIESHDAIYNHYLKNSKLSEEHMLTAIASTPQVRMTRRIDGVTALDWSDSYVRIKDSVGMFGNWRSSGTKANRGEKWELPYSALYGRKIKNLAAAGRCISVTDEMWDITRVIPVCSLSGEAAGTAAALGKNFAEVDIHDLQVKLQANGVMLHWEE